METRASGSSLAVRPISLLVYGRSPLACLGRRINLIEDQLLVDLLRVNDAFPRASAAALVG